MLEGAHRQIPQPGAHYTQSELISNDRELDEVMESIQWKQRKGFLG